MLWLMPASVMEWDQRGQAGLELTGLALELEYLEPLSNWIAIEADEYTLFDISEYHLQFELSNAAWNSTAPKQLFIDAFDQTGLHLVTAGPFNYVVDTTFVPNVITVQDAMHRAAANAFVNSLPMGKPTARRIQLGPTLILDEVRDYNQQVTMRAWLHYNHALVGADEPDHLVVPNIFTC